MPHSNSCFSLSFDSNYGRFCIEPDIHRENIFRLCLIKEETAKIELGKYCSINDAIAAVSQQQTSHLEWDQISQQELPHRVHNIASWEFQQNFGTLAHTACS